MPWMTENAFPYEQLLKNINEEKLALLETIKDTRVSLLQETRVRLVDVIDADCIVLPFLSADNQTQVAEDAPNT